MAHIPSETRHVYMLVSAHHFSYTDSVQLPKRLRHSCGRNPEVAFLRTAAFLIHMHPHPYGVLPLGNLLSQSAHQQTSHRDKRLGSFHVLPDALIIRILDTVVSHFSARDAAICLAHFSAASTATLAFATDEDLWRALTFRMYDVHQIANAPFTQSWRRTFLLFQNRANLKPDQTPFRIQSPVYSDILFHKWRCLTTEVKPQWLAHSNIPRISSNLVTIHQFRLNFEIPNIPVIITDCVTQWPAFSSWSRSALSDRCGDVKFHAGGFNFHLKDYFSYCQAVEGHDDQPLYIFDKDFASKAPTMASDYKVPEYFAEDLFGVLGSHRPDYRWLIIGPTRSGSSFHKDQNSTSAWNAVIKGRKKWVMFPPDVIPPGIYPSGDEGDVTAPVSVSEWFLNFYDRSVLETMGVRECIVEEGEMIFVPMGWWHCVLNLDMSIAITQNYVGSCNFASVLDWVTLKPDQISGCQSPEQVTFLKENFASLVLRKYPHLGRKIDSSVIEKAKEECAKDVCVSHRKRSIWDVLLAPNSNETVDSGEGKSRPTVQETPTKPFAFGF